jgi:nitrate reductase gamma subunit
MFLGMSIFLVFPFTRLVHVWSGFGAAAYLVRPYQLVRSRRIGLTEREPLNRSHTTGR